jgi:predicted nucleotidyltransferase
LDGVSLTDEERERLESILGVKVDLGMSGALKPRMRDRVLWEAVRAI